LDKRTEYKFINLIKLEQLVMDAGMIIRRDEKTKAITNIVYPEIDMEQIIRDLNQLPADCQVEALNYDETQLY
jgi:hypothetical protein